MVAVSEWFLCAADRIAVAEQCSLFEQRQSWCILVERQRQATEVQQSAESRAEEGVERLLLNIYSR